MRVGRAITIWRAIQKRSHEPIYKHNTKNEAKRLRATTFVISKSDILMGSNRGKSNIAIEYQNLFCILGVLMIFSPTVEQPAWFKITLFLLHGWQKRVYLRI